MTRTRKYRAALAAAAVTGLVLTAGPAASAAPSQTPTPSTTDSQSVIVVLKNQHPELPARTARAQRQSTTHNDQAPLVDHAKKSGAANVKTFSIVNAFSAKMSSAEAQHLQDDASVAEVVPDRMVPISPLTAQEKETIQQASASTTPAKTAVTPDNKVLPGSCPTDPSKPLLEPEALQTTQTAYTNPSQPQAQNIVNGSGVKVAWIADGIDVHNPDFIRADGTPVFTDYQDFSGTDASLGGSGGEAFGDASAIAAQGRQVYDLSKFVNAADPLPAGCDITVRGVAPGASMVGLNVFGSSEFAINSVIIQAIDYAVNVANVDVINESFGGNPYPTDGTDPTALADDAAVAAGITVVASTGDAGPTNTMGSPSVDPNVISAGAVTNYRGQAQVGYAGIRDFATSWASNNLSALSSGGVSARGRTADLVAPGEWGWAVCTPDPVLYASCSSFNNEPSSLELFGGTSQSSPLIAGGAALVIQAYKQTHQGVRPSPALVKQILVSSATDLGLPATQQGAGEMNTYRAVRMAMSIKDSNGSPAPQGDGLLVSAGNGDTQLTASGNPGSHQELTLKVTNTSPNTQVVSGKGRILGPKLSDVKSTIAFDATSATAPHFLDGISGAAGPVRRNYVTTTFQVPVGADHLSGQLSWPGGGSQGTSTVRLAIIGPNGEYEDHSLPQGLGNYGTVDVRYPAPGKWTAIFFASASAAGFHGNINYEFTTQKYVDFGSVSGTQTIKPGQTATFHLNAKLPQAAGDESAAIELTTPSHVTTSVPLTLRTDLTPGSFSGTVTGGNGRGNPGAQTQAYYLNVPAGQRDLAVDLTLKTDPNQQVYAALMGPDHQVLSLSTNLTADDAGNVVALASLQGYVRAPQAGRWTLFINVNNPVSGTTLGVPFTGHLRYNSVDIASSGVPHGKVTAGKPITVSLKVRNTGAAPISYFADPRLTTRRDYQLYTLPGSLSTVDLPLSPTEVGPIWLVPAESDTLFVEQSSTIPADFDLQTYNNGVPEQYGVSHGLTANATVTAKRVSQGLWAAAPTALGPTNGPVTGTATFAAVAHTQTFDPAATSSTGDGWLFGTQETAPDFTPLTLQPGQTGTITVTITPTGAKGTTVNGVLYVDDFSSYLFGGDELTAVPYSYTIG